MVVKARAVRVNVFCLVLALLGGVLAGVPAVGASQQSASAQQPRTPLDAESEPYSADLHSAESTTNRAPSAAGGEPSAPDGDLAPTEPAPGDGDGLVPEDDLAPEDGLGAPELGEAVQELGVTDLVGPDGVWIMHDGGREVPLRLLDAAEVAELGEVRSLAASSAASAYAPAAAGNASGASASGAGAVARPDTWFVSDTGQPHLLVGGVNVLFGQHVGGPAIEAVWGRHGVAPGRVSPLGELPNAFLVRTVSDAESLRLADALSAEPGVEAAVPNMFTPFEVGQVATDVEVSNYASQTAAAQRRCTKYTSLWADELSSCQWYLDASGDYRYDAATNPRWQVRDPVADLNLGDAWSTTMGAGVTVAVVDRTWNPNHEDLVDNADTARSTNWGGFTSETTRSGAHHGTAVAGVVGARDNAVGGRGVAPRATLVNYNLLDDFSTAREVTALTLNIETMAVVNMSYGAKKWPGLARKGELYRRALETGLEQGFGGKGTSYVKAAGNGRSFGSRRYWSTLEAANNHRAIISACAVNSAGTTARYSEEGTNLWVCGLSDAEGQAGILVPVGNNHYRDTFGGTSAAAPMVSGVIALMRSANAELTWRDVKVILADTARKVDAQDSGWMSGARKYSSSGPVAETYSFNYQYGFGLVDAEAAVAAAASWALLPPMQTFTATHFGQVPLPGRGDEIELALDLQTSIDFTEHVKVTVGGDISDFRDYRWTLVSPTGTESLLAPEANGCWARMCSLRAGNFDFGSSRHLGENARGTWKLRVQRMPTTPNCSSPSNFSSRFWYDWFCDDSFWEVISWWGVEVTGHAGGPTEPVSMSVAAASVAEGGSVDVTVSVGGTAPTEDLVVPLTLTDVAAEAGADFSAPASVTVPAGSSSATAQISVHQDSIHEGPERFAVRLGVLPLGYRPESGLAVVTIADDDPLPVLSLHAASASVAEGGSVDVAARLSGLSSEDVTVTLAAAAVAPAVASDGWLASPAVLRVPAGSTASSGSVAFAASQNDVYQLSGSAAKTFEVSATARGGNGVADPAAVSLRIDDDESAPVVSIAAGAAVAEGAAAEFTLTASPRPSADLAVGVTVAQQGAFGVTTGVRSVTIPASGSAVLAVRTIDDSAAEPDGSVTVTVAAGVDYTPPSSSASVAVFDDDRARPRVSIAAGSAVTEGSAAEFTVAAFPAPSADLAVSVTVSQQGAFGVVVGTRSVTVPASGSVVLSVATTDDSFGEPDGSVIVAVADGLAYDLAAAATATVVVADDDGGPVPVAVSLSVGDASISENGGATDFEIALSRVLVAGETVRVPITVTGVPGSDWLLGDPTGPGVKRTGYGSTTAVEFSVGGRTAVMRFEAIDDDAELDRPITFSFGTGTRSVTHTGVAGGVAVGGPVTVTIADHDLPPVCDGPPTVSVADATALRGEDFEFRVTLSCRFSRVLVAHYYIGRGSEIDGATRSVTFGPGDTSATASVPTKDSDKVKFQVVYAPGAANALGVPAAVGTVITTPPVVTIAAGADVTEGAAVTFTITAVPAPASPITVTVDISQTGDLAYRPWRRTLVLSNGTATFSVATRDDSIDEPDGSVTATLADGAGYDVGTSSTATINVADDDGPSSVVTITAGTDITEGHSATFTVTAAPPPASPIAVDVMVSAVGDFGATTGARTVTVPTGGSATFAVSTFNDAVDEADGSVTATVVDGAGYDLGAAKTATVAVADDDGPSSVVTITAGTDITEGHSATFTVTAAPPPASPIAVDVMVSAVGDFGATTGARTVTVPTGGSATFAVSTFNDAVDEADGSVTATVVDGAGYDPGTSSTATVVVADDDDPPPQVDITASSGGTEGTSAVFTITAAPQPAADLDVAVAITSAGGFGVTAGTRTATILSGTTQATLTIVTVDDGDDEPDGSVTATLVAGSGYTVGPLASRNAPITDDDDPPPVIPEISIAAAGGVVTEGAGAVFTVTASPPKPEAFDVSVTVSASGEWGVAGGSRTVSFAADAATATLTIPTVDDSVDEADGSVTVSLDAPAADAGYTVSAARGTAAVAVSDDDVDPLTVYMIFFARSIDENGTGYDNQAQFAIAPTRALRSWEKLTVPLSVTGGEEGTHWTMRDLNDPDAVFANEFEVTFGPGDPGVVLEPGDQRVELMLTAVPDSDWVDQEITVWYGTGARAPSLNGSTEGVTLGISWGPDGVERANGSTTVVIIDSDEPPPQIDITAAAGGTEGTDAVFTITASAPTTADLDVAVDIASTGDWGATAGTRTATIPQGSTQTTLTIATVDDDTDEPDGTITATLAAGSGYTIGSHASRAAPISDDDDPPPEPAVAACVGKPTVSVADATAARGDDLEFVISLSCRSTSAVTAYYFIAHGGSYGAGDLVTIASGDIDATVTVPTAGVNSTIELHILYTIGAANNTAKATSTITN
ncbi:S8 family serine peptidase [Candidatus Poriferisodalis sp.]|uniref:S8 family serine peptidase n=1 Tax=Candidatus Poriferisodalis sp. TaxID=3101277 RepID=UPI003B01E7C5